VQTTFQIIKGGVDEDPDLLRHWICNNPNREAASFSETSVNFYNSKRR